MQRIAAEYLPANSFFLRQFPWGPRAGASNGMERAPQINVLQQVTLLKILHLFPDLFKLFLDFDDPLDDGQFSGFAADRIGFAHHLLQQEVEATADLASRPRVASNSSRWAARRTRSSVMSARSARKAASWASR